jgi:hypothetical protein
MFTRFIKSSDLTFMVSSPTKFILALGLFFTAEFSYGLNVMDYLRGYNLGINLIGASEGASVSFDVDTFEDAIPNSVANCGENNFSQYRRCKIFMAGGSSSGLGGSYLRGFGLYLQQPFRRTGEFYFNWDLGIGLQAISSIWENEAGSYDYAGLSELSYSLYGLQFKPYIQIGWTPSRYPDVIFTMGPVVQMVGGSVSVNSVEHQTLFLKSSSVNSSILPWAQSYFELEIVFIRFGEGAFSWFVSRAVTGNDVGAGDFFDKEVGAMSNFSATFNSYESGLKLLMNWP